MKKIMIIGASVLQLPAIKKAKEMGLCVGVCDYDPKAIGIRFVDKYYNVSTIDNEGVYIATKDFGADGIMTLATDMPMRALAYTAEKLSLNGITYQTAVKATDKGEMIKCFEQNDVAHPWFHIVENGEMPKGIGLEYPCVTKPTDNSGSRGVMLVHNEQELREAVEYSAENGRSGSVIVEEYMQGPEVSVEIIVISGEAHVLQITDKLTTGAPHFVEMGHSQPSRLEEKTKEQISALARKAALAVGIKNGPAHVEIIVTVNGPKIVEIGARMGGDCITTHLVPLSTGIDMVEATIRLALGEKPDIEPKFSKGSAIRYFDVPSGTIKSISGAEEAKKADGVREIIFTKGVGETSGEIGSSVDRIGYVIAQSNNAENAVKKCKQAQEMISISVKGKENG